MTDHLATHVHLELWGVDGALLDDPPRLEQVLLAAAAAAKCTVLGSVKHQFQPHGASVVVLVAESHLSIHTWPEHGYAAVDIFTCGTTVKPEIAAEILIRKLGSKNQAIIEMQRGIL